MASVQPQVQARLCFTPQAAHIALTNRANWEAFQEKPDGSVVVTMLAPDLAWLASTALSFGPLVTVLEPQELRWMVHEWASAVSEMYQGEEAKALAADLATE